MTRYELERKTNRLYDLTEELMNTGDEDIDFCSSAILDHLKTILQSVEDYAPTRSYER